MYLIYSVLLCAWLVLFLPFFLLDAWRLRNHLPDLRQRLGSLPKGLHADGRPTIWFHACSVGETLSILPISEELNRLFPGTRFLFSTITRSGQTIAQERFSKYGAENSFYFPADFAWVVRRFLDCIQPRLMIIVDTEIWPNTIHEARKRGIPVILINGRVDAPSFRQYRLVAPFLRSVFENYALLMMKSEEDAERIRRMGAAPEKVLVTGNIKFDRDLVERDTIEAQTQALDTALQLSRPDAPLIVAGSTHDGEERILLEVLRRVRSTTGLEKTRLLLAPRHPERFQRVAELITQQGLRATLRSHPDTNRSDDEVMVLDSVGELAAAYQFATLVFVGGTLIAHGGQSIMEPAVYAKPIVIGPSMENFPQIIDEFLQNNAVVQIAEDTSDTAGQTNALSKVFVRLLRDGAAREALGSAAISVFEGNRGAARVTVEQIATIYRETVNQ